MSQDNFVASLRPMHMTSGPLTEITGPFRENPHSNKDSLHSQLINQNGRVAIVIFDSRAPEGDGDGVYIQARASELEDLKQINHAIEVLGKRISKDEFRISSIKEVTETAAWRVYQAIPEVISKLTDGEYINGQYVDKRVPVDLL